MNQKEIEAEIQKYIRPQTFPIAMKVLKSKEEAPAGTKFPVKDLGVRIMACQAFAMARRYGWTIGLTKDDVKCGTGMVVLGMAPATPDYLEGKFRLTPQNQPPETRSVRLKAMARLPYNEHTCVIFSPLFKGAFDPDLYLIYGNAAQVLRLIQANLFKSGGYMHFKSAGVGACADELATPIIQDQCQMVIPGNGERIFAHTEDGELVFAIPRSKIHLILEGLRLSHEGGQRYPIPSYVRYEPEIPAEYMELTTFLKKP